MAFTSGAANGYYISIAWKEADFTSSGSSKTSASSTIFGYPGLSSSTSVSGSGSNSNDNGSSGSGGNTSSSGGGLSTGSKVGLGIGLGIGIPLILVLVGAWLFRRQSRASNVPPAVVAEYGKPELDGNGIAHAELDSSMSGVGELETTGNARELGGTSRIAATELDGHQAEAELVA
jgi:hypothetical protein